MRRLVTVVLLAGLLLGSIPALAATEPDRAAARQWSSRFASSAAEHAVAVASTPDGRSLFVAATAVADGDADIVTRGVDATSGEVLWRTPIGAADRNERASALAVSADGGRVFVAGSRRDQALRQRTWVVAMLDAATGEVLGRFGQQMPGGAEPPERVLLGGGRIFVVGRGHGSSEGFRTHHTLALAFDAAARTTAWVRRIQPGGPGSDWAVVFDAVYDRSRHELDVAIEVEESDSRESLSVLSLDAVDGHRSWRARWLAPPQTSGEAHPRSLVVDGSRGVAYVGGDFVSQCCVVVAFETGSGDRLWKSSFGRPSAGTVEEIAVSPDGKAIYGVAHEWSSLALHGFAFRLDTRTGAVVWDRRVMPTSEEFDTPPVGLTLTTTDQVIATFGLLPVPCEIGPCAIQEIDSAFLTAAFAADDGQRSWRDVFGGKTYDWPTDVVGTQSRAAACGTFDRNQHVHVGCVGYAT